MTSTTCTGAESKLCSDAMCVEENGKRPAVARMCINLQVYACGLEEAG